MSKKQNYRRLNNDLYFKRPNKMAQMLWIEDVFRVDVATF